MAVISRDQEAAMAYYLRAFCTSDQVPTLAAVLNWVKERGVTLTVNPADIPDGGDTTEWGMTPSRFYYAEGKEPFLVELNRRDSDDSIAAQEINEFLGMLEEVKKTPRKRNDVMKHLRDSKFVVACQVPTADIDDAGFHAIDVFLAYFLVHSGGMVQADGQGFYDMGKLIVELE
jgi:hypothetical protein